MPYFRSIATPTVWLLHKYKVYIMELQINFREEQVNIDVT